MLGLQSMTIDPWWSTRTDVRVGIDKTRNPVLYDLLTVAYIGCPDIYAKEFDHFLDEKKKFY